MAKVFRLFISHSWTYGDAYDQLTKMLNDRPYFHFIDYSVPKDSPIHNAPYDSQLYQAITRQIKPCHVVIILAGVYSTHSKWINKEIQIATKAFQHKKPILAVAPRGAIRISQVVQKNADKIVRWTAKSVVSGIREIAG